MIPNSSSGWSDFTSADGAVSCFQHSSHFLKLSLSKLSVNHGSAGIGLGGVNSATTDIVREKASVDTKTSLITVRANCWKKVHEILVVSHCPMTQRFTLNAAGQDLCT
jgi:hypothetical protein